MNATVTLQGHKTKGIKDKTRKPFRVTRFVVAAAFPALALSGCYVMPVAQDESGRPIYAYSTVPMALNVKLYPINDLANQTGVLVGQVTNMMTGKGRFTFNYQGEILVGEATRVANDERRSIASAYGPGGTFAKCEYQMSSPKIGAGTCTFSNNAMYQLHIGD